MMSKDFDQYKKVVLEYLTTDASTIFGNFTRAHAEFVINSFLDDAQSDIVILSGSFPQDLYFSANGKFVNAVRRVQGNGGKVRIITLNNQFPGVRQLEALCQEYKGTLKHYAANYSGAKPISHFMVVDRKRYRLEVPHAAVTTQEESKADRRAEVCCNGLVKARELLAFFDSVWSLLEQQTKGRQEQSAK